MTYDRATKGVLVGREAIAAVSHGLTSSPQGERGTLSAMAGTPSEAVMVKGLRRGALHSEGIQ